MIRRTLMFIPVLLIACAAGSAHLELVSPNSSDQISANQAVQVNLVFKGPLPAQVTLFVNDQPHHTFSIEGDPDAPLGIPMRTTWQPAQPGTYVLRAIAYDATKTAIAQSQSVSVQVTPDQQALRAPDPPTPTPKPPAEAVADLPMGREPIELPTLLPPPSPTPPISMPLAEVINETLNARSGPSTSFPRLNVLKRGDQLTILARSTDDLWYKVTLPDGQVAWVKAEYVRVISGDPRDVPQESS